MDKFREKECENITISIIDLIRKKKMWTVKKMKWTGWQNDLTRSNRDCHIAGKR